MLLRQEASAPFCIQCHEGQVGILSFVRCYCMLNRIAIVLTLLKCTMSYAQLNITFNVTETIHVTDDLWQLSVTSNGQGEILVDARVTVFSSEDESELYHGQISSIALMPNQTIPLSNLYGRVENELTAFPVDTLLQKVLEKQQTKSSIPKGEYVVCASLFSHDRGMELQRECTLISVSNVYLDSLLSAAKSKFTFETIVPSVQVQSFTYFDIATENTETAFVHRNSSIYISPSVNLWGYPLSASLFLDTDSDFYYSSASTLQLQFDTHAYSAILADRLKQTVVDKSGSLGDSFASASTLLDEYGSINTILANPEVASFMQYADSLEIIQKYASDSMLITVAQDKLTQLQDTSYLNSLLDYVKDSLFSGNDIINISINY